MSPGVPARLLRVFLNELDERLNDFDAGLAALAGHPSEPEGAETIAGLYRGAHSLKGAAASIGLSGIENACVQLEQVLGLVRDGALELDARRRATLTASVAELREAGRGVADAAVAP